MNIYTTVEFVERKFPKRIVLHAISMLMFQVLAPLIDIVIRYNPTYETTVHRFTWNLVNENGSAIGGLSYKSKCSIIIHWHLYRTR